MKIKTILIYAAMTLCSVINLSAQNIPSFVPAGGLIGWYPFSGNADDMSGNGNHATVNGAVLAADRFGNANAAYTFNGLNAFLQGNASGFPTGDRTISLWFYSNNIDVGNTGMQVLGYGGGQCGQVWQMQMDNPDPMAIFAEDAYEVSVGCNLWNTALPFSISTPSPNGNWHHWITTTGITGTDFYIDGVYNGGVTQPISGTQVAGKKFFIGACPDSTGLSLAQTGFMTCWNGLLDDIGIWNRVLTQQEITALYNGTMTGTGVHSAPNPVAIFPNPARDLIYVKSDRSLEGMSYVLLDYTGRIVKSGKLGPDQTRITIPDLVSGVYWFTLGEQIEFSYRIVKE